MGPIPALLFAAFLSGTAMAEGPSSRGIRVEHLTDLYVTAFSGDRQRPEEAILLLHGFPAYTGKNEELADFLAKDAQTEAFVVHYRGLGQSGGKFSFMGAVADVTRLCERLARRGYRRLTLVGHSFGGAVALMVAERVPSVSATVLLSPLVEVPPESEMLEDLAGFVAHEATLGHHYDLEGLMADARAFRRAYSSRRIADAIQARGTRLAIIQATGDDVIDPAQVRAWCDGLASPPAFFEVVDDHWFTTTRESVAATISRWLRRERE